MKTVLIIGVGQFGSHIARRMEELRCEVMAVDENEKHINDILPYVTNETTSLLKELGAKKVISRATNDVQMKFLLKNGADEVVYPEKQMALRIATKYASDSILDFIHLDNNYSIYELKVPKDWFGKSLSQIDIRKKFKINILTIKRGEEVFIPSPDTVIETDDIAFVIGEVRDIQKCFRI